MFQYIDEWKKWWKKVGENVKKFEIRIVQECKCPRGVMVSCVFIPEVEFLGAACTSESPMSPEQTSPETPEMPIQCTAIS